jgi:ssRNA-specific RNase YbeY (16S rRNA maturation enzyme)
VFGGNLGKPQSVAFIAQCLRLNQNRDDRYFLICGEGTEGEILAKYIKDEAPTNVMLLPMLPTQEYDELLRACDVGMIFLDYRFTIPNFPSRLLS